MELKSVKEIPKLKNKRVLLRLDLDVSVGSDGFIDDCEDARIKSALPSIEFLIKKNARITIVGHMGRPGGRVNGSLVLLPVVKRMATLLGESMNSKTSIEKTRLNDFDAYSLIIESSRMKIDVLENIRFFPGETRNHANLASKLATLADVYVNDAFAVSHRAHASINAITKKLPPYAGIQLIKEVKNLGKVLKRPPRPLTLIMGGVKAETKLKLIEKFLPRSDYVLLGSALANNFYSELGFEIGNSRLSLGVGSIVKRLISNPAYTILGDVGKNILINPDEVANPDIKTIKSLRKRIILPPDVVLGEMHDNKRLENNIRLPRRTVLVRADNPEISPHPYSILDIGSVTVSLYKEIIKHSKTIIWNGPMGMFENEQYDYGTYQIAKSVAESKGRAIIGGGDTVTAVESDRIDFSRNTFISTGGGAMLEFLINPNLPGISPLIKRTTA